jgi:hypothetical protein
MYPNKLLNIILKCFSAQKIFSGEIKNHLLMFLSKKSEAYQGQYDIAASIAKV